MLPWLHAHGLQLTLVFGVIVFLSVGRKPLLARVRDHTFLLWMAFIVTAACGLILGWALHDLTAWITSLPGSFGGVVASIGAVAAVIFGWWSIYMLVDLVRDLADLTPDADARKAALWVPTLAPAGLTAAWNIVTNPRGIGTGITAAIIAVISAVFLHKTISSALSSKKHRLFWKWFATAPSLLAGLIMLPLYAFGDSLAGKYLPGDIATDVDIFIGVVAAALLVAAVVDIWPRKDPDGKGDKKKLIPDAGVRMFLAYGLPALIMFGGVGVAAASDAAGKQSGVVTGSVTK